MKLSPSPVSKRLRTWRQSTSRPISVIIGTRAQLIKMAPLLRELESRHFHYRLIFTGQHTVTMKELLADFEVQTEPELVYQGKEVSSITRMLFWMPLLITRLFRRRHAFLRNHLGQASLVLVHGDTFSTLAGALAARLAGCPVGHVESGLRSFNILNPFPEELTRLLVFRLTDIAFCPGAWATANLANHRLEAIDTGHNTLIDALRAATSRPDTQTATFKPHNYCVASIHRFENIFIKPRLVWIIGTLKRIAQETEVIFVLHPSTAKRLDRYHLLDDLQKHERIHLRERMPYFAFVHILRDAQFVVTDGGSNQEELHYLGRPTLLIRNATERREGLDDQTMLCRFDDKIVTAFLSRTDFKNEKDGILHSDTHPVSCIVDALDIRYPTTIIE